MKHYAELGYGSASPLGAPLCQTLSTPLPGPAYGGSAPRSVAGAMAKHHPDLIFCRKQAGVGEYRTLTWGWAAVRARWVPFGPAGCRSGPRAHLPALPPALRARGSWRALQRRDEAWAARCDAECGFPYGRCGVPLAERRAPPLWAGWLCPEDRHRLCSWSNCSRVPISASSNVCLFLILLTAIGRLCEKCKYIFRCLRAQHCGKSLQLGFSLCCSSFSGCGYSECLIDGFLVIQNAERSA